MQDPPARPGRISLRGGARNVLRGEENERGM
jgi:hypothetical protein